MAGAHLAGTLHDGLALAGGHVVRDLAGVRPVVHHQQLEVLHVRDHELPEACAGHKTAFLAAGGLAGWMAPCLPMAKQALGGVWAGILKVRLSRCAETVWKAAHRWATSDGASCWSRTRCWAC